MSAALGTRQHVLDLVNYQIAFSRLTCCLAYKPRKFSRLLFCFAIFAVACIFFLSRFCVCFSIVRNQANSFSCSLAFLVLFSSVVIVIKDARLFQNVYASIVVYIIIAQFFIISITLLQNNLCSMYNSCCWAIFS